MRINQVGSIKTWRNILFRETFMEVSVEHTSICIPLSHGSHWIETRLHVGRYLKKDIPAARRAVLFRGILSIWPLCLFVYLRDFEFIRSVVVINLDAGRTGRDARKSQPESIGKGLVEQQSSPLGSLSFLV